MRSNSLTRLALMILIGATVATVPTAVLAQRREGGRERERHRVVRRAPVVVRPPVERTRVVVGSREYFYARGVFYRSGPKGYIAIRGPIGARIKTLPSGYINIAIGGKPFFLYYGTYYRFDPAVNEYVVVAPPADAPTVPGLDRIDLVTGEAINGTYLGGTQSTIQVDVNGKVQEIPVEQIISIVFAPPDQ